MRTKWSTSTRDMDMADTETVQVVDVNVDSAGDTWPVLLRAVCRADFIALDLVSGLDANLGGLDLSKGAAWRSQYSPGRC